MFDYEQSVDAYNAEVPDVKVAGARTKGRFERGSLLQRITDPFDGAPRDEDGSIIYRVSEEEMQRKGVSDDDKLKALYDKRKGQGEVWDLDEEDEEAFRNALVQELEDSNTPFDINQWHEQLNAELAVFKNGEKYNFVKDLKEAYGDSLRTTTE